jgi:hypothetical protein
MILCENYHLIASPDPHPSDSTTTRTLSHAELQTPFVKKYKVVLTNFI